ncbi:MAG: V-type ATP synthase subunit A, partial [Parachlamydiaceae bacterium]|nr:V-type ATP synthase subunit A [Parachlamydiaceae bacterium]
GNFEEPVTQATLAVVGAFLGLSRERSDSRRYPAIDPLISWSKYIVDVAQELEKMAPGWGKMVHKAKKMLHNGDEIGKRMEVVGEEGTALEDLIIYLKAELFDFSYLQQNSFDKQDAYCPLERQIVLFQLVNKCFEKIYRFHDHDEARKYFLTLQNQIKNMNFLAYDSDEYRNSFEAVEHLIESGK